MWQAVIGIVVILGVAWVLSESKSKLKPRQIVMGLLLQIVLAVMLLKIPVFKDWVELANQAVGVIEKSTQSAASFMFGYLSGGETPFEIVKPGADFIVAFRVLPLVVIMSALSALLFHWNILPLIVRGMAFVLSKTLRISGASGLAAAADVFLGIAEAPLFVRPYLGKMTRAELFMVMSCGMASVAGTVMVLYASVLNPVIPGAIGHILVASVISIPAALVIAQVMVPETETTVLSGERWRVERTAESSLDAIVKGTADGVQMLISIVALIIVVFALVHLANGILGIFGNVGGETISLQRIVSYLLYPFMWLMGIHSQDLWQASSLMANKILMNEFVAYLEMAKLSPEQLTGKSRIILTYGMCGFANMASLGILIGTMTSLVPQRRSEILELGFRSLIAGNLATMMTGALAGVVLT
jgi:CNT family concentrative nucleoside transporter